MNYFKCVLFLCIVALKPAVAKNGHHHVSSSICYETFDCPQIDDSHQVITPSTCNGADGSIAGITGTGTGTVRFVWMNVDRDIISTTADLINVAPGVYTLKVYDESKCTPAQKSYIVGQKNGVVIIDGGVKINPATCDNTDGSITGITAQNADTYQWYYYGKVVATTANLTNVGSGDYTLVASNAMTCSSTSTYTVPNTISFPTVTHIDTIAGSCSTSAGFLTLTFNSKPSDPVYTYYVLDDGGGKVKTGGLVYSEGNPSQIAFEVDAPNVNYSVVLIDPKGCILTVGKYLLPQPVFGIVTKNVLVRNDACGRHTGGVFQLGLTGGTKPQRYFGMPPNQAYTWTDSLGNVVGRAPDLTGVSKGVYTLVVKDVMGCSDSKQFTVSDSLAEATPPVLNNSSLCLPGTVTLSVINPNSKFIYRLYDSTQTAVTENNYGIFQQKVNQTSKYYVATVNGLCESERTPVTVTIVAPGVIIPNTFTPNNDGINDYWNIPHVADFPGAEVSVFTRDGALIFHSINYAHPFDGKNLPAGVYYYVINLKKKACFGKISGSLTLVR